MIAERQRQDIPKERVWWCYEKEVPYSLYLLNSPQQCRNAAAGWNLTERVIKLWLQEVFTIWLFSLRRQLKSTAHFKSRNLHPERMISYDDRTGFYAWILKKQEWVPWHNIQCLKFYHRSYRNIKNGVVSNGTLSLPVKYMTGDKSDGKLIFPTNTIKFVQFGVVSHGTVNAWMMKIYWQEISPMESWIFLRQNLRKRSCFQWHKMCLECENHFDNFRMMNA